MEHKTNIEYERCIKSLPFANQRSSHGFMQTQSLHWHTVNPSILCMQPCQCVCNKVTLYWELSDSHSSLGGLEPPSSRLTAERASLLRHRDCLAFPLKAHTGEVSGFTFYANQAKTGFNLQKRQERFSFPQRHNFWNDCNFEQALTSSSGTSFSNATWDFQTF